MENYLEYILYLRHPWLVDGGDIHHQGVGFRYCSPLKLLTYEMYKVQVKIGKIFERKLLMKSCETCLYLVRCYSFCTAERELQDRCCSSSKEVLPVDWIDVSGLRVFSAGSFCSLLPAMVGIVELDNQSIDSFTSLFNVHQHSSATVGQSVQGVYVVYKNYFSSYLDLQHSLKRGVLDAAGIVGLEGLYCLAGIFGLDGEHLAWHLFQLAVVPGVHLGICAVDVEGIVDTWVRHWTHSCFQQ